MVDFEPKVNGEKERHSPVSGLAGRAANVAGDFIELAELQAQLAKADAELAAKNSVRPIAVLLIGVCGALASLPVLALGFSALINEATVLKEWQSQLLVGGVLAAVAGLTIYLATRGIRRAAGSFERSATELAKNIAWLKTVLGKTPNHPEPQMRFQR